MTSLPPIGAHATLTRQFLREDVQAFSEVSGDMNPIHLDEGFAADTVFKRPIVHGILVASQISRLLAQELPGPGSIYVSQSLRFIKPVYWGDLITARVEVTEIRPEKRMVTLRTTCTREPGVLVLEGEAVIKLI